MSRKSMWTEEEDTIIREKYPRYGSCCAEHLPHRTVTQIQGRANQLGVHLEGVNTLHNATPERVKRKELNHRMGEINFWRNRYRDTIYNKF